MHSSENKQQRTLTPSGMAGHCESRQQRPLHSDMWQIKENKRRILNMYVFMGFIIVKIMLDLIKNRKTRQKKKK